MEKNSQVWSIYLNNQDVFASVLKLTGRWQVDEGIDLIHDFILDRLPIAIHSFDPQKGKIKSWLFIVFIRYAKRRRLELNSNSKRKIDLDNIGELPQGGTSIDEYHLTFQRKKVNYALNTLNKTHQEILQTFFGDSSSANNVRALARKYNLSRHRAEKMLLEGLAMLSAQLNEPGILSKEEMLISKYYFLEGKAWERIAELTGKTEFHARSTLKNALTKFRSLLT